MASGSNKIHQRLYSITKATLFQQVFDQRINSKSMHSPNLTKSLFSFGTSSYSKDKVYKNEPANIKEMKNNIRFKIVALRLSKKWWTDRKSSDRGSPEGKLQVNSIQYKLQKCRSFGENFVEIGFENNDDNE